MRFCSCLWQILAGCLLAGWVCAVAAAGQDQPAIPPAGGDIPAKFEPATTLYDFDKREAMIPMRDGVKLYALIVIPKGVMHAPIILDRTPYSAAKIVPRVPSPHVALALPLSFGELAQAGYIIVVQDVREKYKSEGSYIMSRPLSGPLNDSGVDHATDAYDTIDWLVKNVPESNGKVGTMGTSYDGFTVLMSRSCIFARTSDHGANSIELVSALRSQSAELRGEYLLREARRLCQGAAARLSHPSAGELH